jgi:prophage regulatory protein
MNAVLRLPAVQARVGLSRSSIYLRIARNEFPKPISLGARAIGFLESEISSWIASRPAPSSAPVAKKRSVEVVSR